MAKYLGKRWYYIQIRLMDDFNKWCEQRHGIAALPENMAEFLLQMDFIRGKRWLQYIDILPDEPLESRLRNCKPLRDGMYPPDCIIGHKE